MNELSCVTIPGMSSKLTLPSVFSLLLCGVVGVVIIAFVELNSGRRLQLFLYSRLHYNQKHQKTQGTLCKVKEVSSQFLFPKKTCVRRMLIVFIFILVVRFVA